MRVSFDDAFGLLSKWKTEASPVSGILVLDGGGCSVCFGGTIRELLTNGLLITYDRNQDAEMMLEFRIALQTAVAFDYQDLREAPPEIRARYQGKIASGLTIVLPGAKCSLFEGEA